MPPELRPDPETAALLEHLRLNCRIDLTALVICRQLERRLGPEWGHVFEGHVQADRGRAIARCMRCGLGHLAGGGYAPA